MKIAMMACTARGFDAMRRCGDGLRELLPGAEILTGGRCADVPGYEDGPRLSELTAAWFWEADALFFFSAAGIAVRCIAPFVCDKYSDPAVLVIDENARFVISLLSGHAGGANRLCLLAAQVLGAQPVITTATDGRGLFAIDVFAAQNSLQIHDRTKAKMISARLLAGEMIAVCVDDALLPHMTERLCSDHPKTTAVCADDAMLQEDGFRAGVEGSKNPEGAGFRSASSSLSEETEFSDALSSCGSGAYRTREHDGADVIISFRRLPQDPENALYLIPRAVTLGIGCRRGAEGSAIREAASRALEEAGVFAQALRGIATIDLKKDEEGLLEFSRQWGLPISFYTARELDDVPGAFSSSPFVRDVTGVDNVCERAAVLLAGSGGRLLAGKRSGGGVTTALGLCAAF